MAMPGTSLVRLRALCSVVTGHVRAAQTATATGTRTGTGFLSYGTKAWSSEQLKAAPLSRSGDEDSRRRPPASSRNTIRNKDLLQEFPQPKILLYNTLTSSLGITDLSQVLQYSCSKQSGLKRATVTLRWPCTIEEEGYASNRLDAESFAAAAACLKLRDLGVLKTAPTPKVGGAPVPADAAAAAAAVSLFPQPKNVLHNVLQLASNHSKLQDVVKFKKSRERRQSKCTLTVRWPEEMTFTAWAHNGGAAERAAAALACVWLKELKLLDKDNKPLRHYEYHKEQVREANQKARRPVSIHVPQHLQDHMKDYLSQFPVEAEVQKMLEEEEQRALQALHAEEEEDCVTDAITSKPYRPLDERQALHLSDSLRDLWERADPPLSLELPVDAHRQRVVEAVSSSRVVVIAGETGCGKTTRIPRFLLEEHVRRGTGASCNVLVTQPRRISAVSVAHRVAQELGPKLQHCVGYQVRFDSCLPASSGGAMMFMTLGVLLKKLQSNPHLQGISHVVVDEVHERDINTDLVLALLRSCLKENPDLRVVLMSATGDNHRLAEYFGNCPIVKVPGFMHPVKDWFLDDVLSNMDRSSAPVAHAKQRVQDSSEASVDLDLVADVIEHIDKHGEPGAMLCFLPGWQEIKAVQESLESREHFSSQEHKIVLLHSSLSVADQQKVFQRPPEGQRKIVLATNIAETSITIDDIVHVIDTGAHKEHSYDPHTKVSCLDTVWISRSNVIQRKGRAGRCQPGYSYHLFTRAQMETLKPFAVPEILRTSLEMLIMQSKIHSPHSKAEDFLSQVLDNPEKEAVRTGVQSLQDIGVLDKEEFLTPLGRHVACMTCDPQLGKILVLSWVFGCVHPLLSVVSCLTKDPFHSSLQNRALVNKSKKAVSGSSFSDYLVLSRIMETWKRVRYECSHHQRYNFLTDYTLSQSSLRFITGLMLQFSDNLRDAGLVHRGPDCVSVSSVWNSFSGQEEMLKAVLLAGLYPNLIQVKKGSIVKKRFDPKSVSLRTTSGPVVLHRSSVNRDQDLPSRWLTFFNAVKSNGCVFIRDSSVVHPLALLLLTDTHLTATEKKNKNMVEVSFSSNPLVSFQLSLRSWELLGGIRTSIHTMMHRALSDPANPRHPEGQHQRLLSLLMELLNGTHGSDQDQDQDQDQDSDED